MNLETGTPLIEGRYVVFVPGFQGWLEPFIVLWHKGGWRHRNSSEPYTDVVHSWARIPVIKYTPIDNLPFDPTAQSETGKENPGENILDADGFCMVCEGGGCDACRSTQEFDL